VSGHEDEELASAWHDLMGRYHRITCTLDRELLARHDLTVSEFEVLQELHSAADPTSIAIDGAGDADSIRMHELGERVHLTQSALSRLISRLERDGLVERGMCLEDRRSVWARITPAGAERYVQARPTQRAILRDQAVGCIESSKTLSPVSTRQ
jgi:DNA-binding MarR family transcriptional regulator